MVIKDLKFKDDDKSKDNDKSKDTDHNESGTYLFNKLTSSKQDSYIPPDPSEGVREAEMREAPVPDDRGKQVEQIKMVLKDSGADSMAQVKSLERIKEILGW